MAITEALSSSEYAVERLTGVGTRGDGETDEDVTHNAISIPATPKAGKESDSKLVKAHALGITILAESTLLNWLEPSQ